MTKPTHIPIYQRKEIIAYALVDQSDYQSIAKYIWGMDASGYARRSIKPSELNGRKYRTMSMHRQIMNDPAGMEIDHIDGDKLNNCRNNLRVCLRSENLQNYPIRKDNTSGYRGVSFQKARNKWVAKIRASRVEYFLGLFTTAEEAARAYNAAAIEHYGAFARLNKGV